MFLKLEVERLMFPSWFLFEFLPKIFTFWKSVTWGLPSGWLDLFCWVEATTGVWAFWLLSFSSLELITSD